VDRRGKKEKGPAWGERVTRGGEGKGAGEALAAGPVLAKGGRRLIRLGDRCKEKGGRGTLERLDCEAWPDGKGHLHLEGTGKEPGLCSRCGGGKLHLSLLGSARVLTGGFEGVCAGGC